MFGAKASSGVEGAEFSGRFGGGGGGASEPFSALGAGVGRFSAEATKEDVVVGLVQTVSPVFTFT